MDYTTNTFLLDELALLKDHMEDNQAPRITFGDKIKDWPRADVLDLLTKYDAATSCLTPGQCGITASECTNCL
jgi:hypothetical protein